jgi:hypothetical protein
MPLQFSRVRIQRDDAVAVEVVAFAIVAVPIGPGITDAPIRQIQFGIVRTGQPDRGASGFPRVPLPRFEAGFAGSGHEIEAPRFVAGGDVKRGEESTDAVFSAGRSHDHFVFDDERRGRERVSRLGTHNFFIPQQLSVLCIDRNHVTVDRAHEQTVAMNGDAAIQTTAARARLR